MVGEFKQRWPASSWTVLFLCHGADLFERVPEYNLLYSYTGSEIVEIRPEDRWLQCFGNYLGEFYFLTVYTTMRMKQCTGLVKDDAGYSNSIPCWMSYSTANRAIFNRI